MIVPLPGSTDVPVAAALVVILAAPLRPLLLARSTAPNAWLLTPTANRSHRCSKNAGETTGPPLSARGRVASAERVSGGTIYGIVKTTVYLDDRDAATLRR